MLLRSSVASSTRRSTRSLRDLQSDRDVRVPRATVTAAAALRQREILGLLTAGDPDTPLVERVCEVSARLLGVSGAGMCLVGGVQHQIVVHGTNTLAEELEDLQVTLGEGPCIQAVRTALPVLVPRLAGYRAPTWQVFADRAVARGVRAVFSFPLQAGTVQLGALDLYRGQPGPLDTDQAADALVLTAIATQSMLAQQDRIHLDGSVSALHWLTAVDGSSDPDSRGRAVDLGITVEQALAPNWPDGGNDALGSPADHEGEAG